MGMPLDLVFVRHGESEANILQQAEKMVNLLTIYRLKCVCAQIGCTV